MKLVIEIDKARFRDIQRIAEVQPERSHFQTAEQIIAKGVPMVEEPCSDAVSRQYLLDNCVMDKVIMPYVPINRIENAPSVNPQPCEDAISREDTEECKELMTDINGDTVYAVRMSDIRQLPSVNPQQKTGYWIAHSDGIWIKYYECSECGKVHDTYSDYCPNCGTKMPED